MEQGLGFLRNMLIASPPGLGAPSPPVPSPNRDAREAEEVPPLVSRQWTQGATRCFLKLVKENIETYGSSLFQQKHWVRIREQLVKDHPSEEKRTWLQVRDKWDKLKRHYFKEKKVYNLIGDNGGFQWV